MKTVSEQAIDAETAINQILSSFESATGAVVVAIEFGNDGETDGDHVSGAKVRFHNSRSRKWKV
jgi:hypothetical protein